ncbi:MULTISPECIES: zinc ABC transporter substrate-binding protein [unclassified Halomonas]|uniref:metal ABC transporter solute-binding protein, Zn/Mn family n=1 Tax=unclassified Halomonas TaxID=2609666 RepID=UPI001EF43AA0|nr:MULTISPECIES: zinc ABC transporter substrate-binding protein [unclassified Halomonas]MCG7576706.1 zinc ABC transporter substrate-binding protein [Halomonas sp. MMH1-48]MCG7603769.1 zinc ABC transporter substrate-binding protein [Halomonas sp. MM17-34]MCG7613019.1 zinc ABC transporter substrate-binding protein [Halomonas sp. MM17-29]MCG7619693.1 zinc ABC transporter substrate-binding protein [Halomonas sp. DSH1-27]
MDKRISWIITLLLVATFISSPSFAASSAKIIASFSVIEDLVKRVAGDDISITTIVPIGEDVHRWELTPPNVLAVEEADIVFYNGHGLEPWIRHLKAMASDRLTLVALAEMADYPTLTLQQGQYEGSPDPHMWMAPHGAAAYIDVIMHTLSARFPERADAFRTRAEEAKDALSLLDQQVIERLEGIPHTNRLITMSEAGLSYFAHAYGFEFAAIWGLNSETMGSAHDMASMSERLVDKRPPALFFESTTPDIHMDALARETGLTLAGPLYVDTLSEADGPAYNYPALLHHTTELLHEALGGARAEE